jgi:hypothetical protein
MRKLAFLSVAFALVVVSFYGCAAGPTEPDSSDESSVNHEQTAVFDWGEYDFDSFLLAGTVYLECLDETVVREGEWIWYAWINWPEDNPHGDRYKEGRWFSPTTTMVGPSGTWTILRQLGPKPGQAPVKYNFDHVIWEAR